MVPKFKSSNRFAKHRSLKIRDFERGDIPRNRPSKTQTRHRDIARKDAFAELHSDDFRAIKHSNLHEDSMEYTRRATTARVIRRKPRDRFEKRQSDDGDPLAELGLGVDDSGIMNNDRLGDYRSDTEFRRGGGPPLRPEDDPGFSENDFQKVSGFQRRPSVKEIVHDKEDAIDIEMKNNPQDYSDYYDMKRVETIKNKLPSLLHISTEGKFLLHFLKFSVGDYRIYLYIEGVPKR